MEFTQGCFIRKSSNDIRITLEKLGYRLFGLYLNQDLCLFTEPKYGLYSFELFSDIPRPEETDHIDCGTNENLFLAIAALRGDSDIHQWFVNENKSCWWKCSLNEFKQDFELSNEDKNLSYKYFHKATIEELIEHFKNNGEEYKRSFSNMSKKEELAKKYAEDEYCSEKNDTPRYTIAQIHAASDGYIAGWDEALKGILVDARKELPEYGEDVWVINEEGEQFFCHRSNNPNVIVDKDGWCNYWKSDIVAWIRNVTFDEILKANKDVLKRLKNK